MLEEARVLSGVGKRQRDDYQRRGKRSSGYNKYRQHEAHAKHGQRHAPREEALLPLRRHMAQHFGINYCVVEGERYLEHCKRHT